MFSYKIMNENDLQYTFPNFGNGVVNVFGVNGTKL